MRPVFMSDTIDLTPVVDSLKEGFVLASEAHIIAIAMATPGVGPFASWIIQNLLRHFIRWSLERLADSIGMQAFFLNTAIRKSRQAEDYVKAVEAINALPDNVSDVTYREAELAKIGAFHNFVRISL